MLPNFFCIGAAKAGTTSLHDIISQHPDVYLPLVKETKFFSLNYAKGISWYEQEYFRQWKGEKAVGEIYPCMSLEEAPKRLYESLGPDLKLIVMLRNPIDRAYSNFLAQKRLHNYEINFEEALLELPFLVENGLYSKNISRFLEYFPIDQMKFILFETDFLEKRHETIAEVQRFLGVNPQPLNVGLKSNATWEPRSRMLHALIFQRPRIVESLFRFLIKSKSHQQQLRIFLTKVNSRIVKSGRLPVSVRNSLLEEYFFSDIQKLEDVIGRDLSIWFNKVEG